MTSRFARRGIGGVALTVILGVILVAANLLTSEFPVRLDLTANKDYSLSAVTKGKLQKLDTDLDIRAYFSKELPTSYLLLKQDVADVLANYEEAGKGKVKVSFQDPKDDPQVAHEVQAQGIPELQFSGVEKDKFQVSTGYLGMVLSYGAKQEVIPVVESTQFLEFDLTSAINRLVRVDTPKVGLLAGVDGIEQNELMVVSRSLGKQYAVADVSLSDGKPVPDDITTLVVASPKKELSDWEKYQVDQFIMRGRGVVFLVDGVDVDNTLNAQPAKGNIGSLLEGYGLKVNQDLVLDASSELASFSSGRGAFTTQYPYWVKVRPEGFDKDNVAVNRLQSLVLPWASTISPVREKLGEARLEELVWSSSQSWLVTSDFNLNPTQRFAPNPEEFSNRLLAASLSGPISSAFSEGAIPQPPAGGENARPHQAETGDGRIIVVADSYFARDVMSSRFPENDVFFQNLVDYLTQEPDLISIRSKGIENRPLRPMSDGERDLVRAINVVVPLILVAAVGVGRAFQRRRAYQG